MYLGANTVVRTAYGYTEGFVVNVGMHQGFGLHPLVLLVIVMEAISCKFSIDLPWKLLYADDLINNKNLIQHIRTNIDCE